MPLCRGSIAHGIPIRIPWTPDCCKQCLDSQTPVWRLSSEPSVPKESPPPLLFFIPHTNVKATFRGRSNQGHVHNAGRTSRGLRLSPALKCESAFRGSCSPQTVRTSTLTWFQMEEVEGQTQPPFFVRVPPFLFKAIVCNKWLFLPLRLERCFGLLFKCHKDVWFILAGYTTLE